MAGYDATSCPDDQVLRDWIAGNLDDARAQPLSKHVESCAVCRDKVVRFKAESSGAKSESTPASRTVPAPTMPNVSQEPTKAQNQPEELDLREIDLAFLKSDQSGNLVGKMGHYDIVGLLGHGGMGIVLKAFDPSLNRPVAIKVMSPQLSASEKARRRFLREARAAAAINHPNVVTIHAVSEHAGLPYLVMEYVHGCSLRQRLRRQPPLDLAGVLRISAQIAHGLAAAHAQGLIHRDIKPANIMLEDEAERVKITDFGLARAAQDLSEITSQGHPVGTPAYMAPEQMNGSQVDARSDLFGVGCVMFAMFTGHSPFHSANNLEVMRKVADYKPPLLHDQNPQVPRVVSNLVNRLLEKDPNSRLQSSAELAEILTQHVATINQTQSGKIPVFDLGLGNRTVFGRTVPGRWITLATACVVAGLAVGLTVLEAMKFFGNTAGAPSHTQGAATPPTAGTVPGESAADAETTASLPMCVDEVKSVMTAAIWPAGPRVLFGGEPETDVVFWDWEERRVVGRLVGHQSWVRSVAFDRDGRQAITASGGSWKLINGVRPGGDDFSIRLWDVESRTELKRLEGHTGAVTCVTFLRDGQRAVSGSNDYTIRVWSLDTGEELRAIESNAREPLCVAASPVDDHVAVGCYRLAGIWNADSGQLVFTLDSGKAVHAIAYSPDGRLVATGTEDGAVNLWSAPDGQFLRRVAKHEKPVRSVAFSADNQYLLSGGDDRTLRLSALESGEEMHRIQAGGAVRAVAFCPDGEHVLSGGLDGSGVRLWSLHDTETEPAPPSGPGP